MIVPYRSISPIYNRSMVRIRGQTRLRRWVRLGDLELGGNVDADYLRGRINIGCWSDALYPLNDSEMRSADIIVVAIRCREVGGVHFSRRAGIPNPKTRSASPAHQKHFAVALQRSFPHHHSPFLLCFASSIPITCLSVHKCVLSLRGFRSVPFCLLVALCRASREKLE
jgi:hypothetical protein